MSIKEELIGNTIKVTWINSGITPSDIFCAVYTGSETMVDSATMQSSGDGHYFHLHTAPDTPGFYVAETKATINSKPYKNRIKYKAILDEVD